MDTIIQTDMCLVETDSSAAVSETVTLNWKIELSEFFSELFLIGKNKEYAYEVRIYIGKHFSSTVILEEYDNILRYAHQLRFDRNYLNKYRGQIIMRNHNPISDTLFFPKNFESPRDYIYLLTAMLDAKKHVIKSEDDITICFNPKEVFLGLENYDIMFELVDYDEKFAVFLRTHPEKITEIKSLAVFSTNNFYWRRRVLDALRPNSEGILVFQDKNFQIHDISEMKTWEVKDFRVAFELNAKISDHEFIEKYLVCSDLVSLKQSLKADGLNTNGIDWVLVHGAKSLPFANPRSNVLIREIRNKINNDYNTVLLLSHIVTMKKYNAFNVLEYFLKEELYNYPFEWASYMLDNYYE